MNKGWKALKENLISNNRTYLINQVNLVDHENIINEGKPVNLENLVN